jgi:putative lysine transport system permease protein
MSFFEKVWFLILHYYPLFLTGIAYTMGISILGTIAGFIIGLFVAVIRTIPVNENDNIFKRAILAVVKFICVAYIEVFRGTPMMIQAAVIYYGIFMGIDININFAALIIVSINTGSYMAEIIRGGIISINKGQTEGAHSIGMTHWQTMLNVVLPQAIRNIMPSVGNEFVVNIKDTSVLNVIGVAELYFQSKSAAGTYAMFFQSFSIAAVIYFILTFTVTRILRYIEKRMDGPSSYVIYGSQTDAGVEVLVDKGGADNARH